MQSMYILYDTAAHLHLSRTCTVQGCFDVVQTKDQTWTMGNLALQDSLRQRLPVRVVRGSTENVK